MNKTNQVPSSKTVLKAYFISPSLFAFIAFSGEGKITNRKQIDSIGINRRSYSGYKVLEKKTEKSEKLLKQLKEVESAFE